MVTAISNASQEVILALKYNEWRSKADVTRQAGGCCMLLHDLQTSPRFLVSSFTGQEWPSIMASADLHASSLACFISGSCQVLLIG